MPDRCPRCYAELTTGANFCARCGAQLGASVASNSEDPYLGRVLLGRYRVVRALGEGGMGRVYLAEQAMGQASRPVALKTLRKEWMSEPRASGRFLRESEIVIRLAHPNTIQFYDFGELDDGSLVIVMEYIEGTTLAEALRAGPFPLDRVDALLTQICGSLAEAHAHGIVHRDLKPHNVLLTTRAGYSDFVKVVDFGIALQSGVGEADVTRLTTQGTLIGTPPYMSPEQFQGQVVDAHSDVYSLGVVVYQMLTGALPFEAKTPWQWAAAHTEQRPRPITEHAATRDLARHSADAIMRALEKDPARRQSDAGELLREFLGDRRPTHVSMPAAVTVTTPSLAASVPPAPASELAELAPTVRAPVPPAPPSGPWRILVIAVVLVLGLGAFLWLRQSMAEQQTAAAAAKRARPKAARAPRKARVEEEQPRDSAQARAEAALRAGRFDRAAPLVAALAREGGAEPEELESLRRRLIQLALDESDRLSGHQDCPGLARVQGALEAAGVTPPEALERARGHCEKAPSIPADGGPPLQAPSSPEP